MPRKPALRSRRRAQEQPENRSSDGPAGTCRLFGRCLAVRITEIFEEIGIWPQHEPRVIGAQPRLVGLHGSVEGEEIRILAVGFGEDAVALGVALAARLLGLRGRL